MFYIDLYVSIKLNKYIFEVGRVTGVLILVTLEYHVIII